MESARSGDEGNREIQAAVECFGEALQRDAISLGIVEHSIRLLSPPRRGHRSFAGFRKTLSREGETYLAKNEYEHAVSCPCLCMAVGLEPNNPEYVKLKCELLAQIGLPRSWPGARSF